MGKTKYTEEIKKAIKKEYDEGASVLELSDKYNAPKQSIYGIIKSQGGTLRRERKLSYEQKEAIKHKYEVERKSCSKLAEEYSVSKYTIIKAVRELDGKIRDAGDKGKQLTNEEKEEILFRYKKGNITVKQLAREYSISYDKITIALEEKGGAVRKAGDWRRALTNEQCTEIEKEYREKMISTAKLASKYGVKTNTIRKAIVRAGGAVRSKKEARRVFTDEQESRICEEYKSTDITIQDLGKKYEVCYSAMLGVVRRAGIRIRKAGEYNSLLTDSEKKIVRTLHLEKAISIKEIADKFKVSESCIRNALPKPEKGNIKLENKSTYLNKSLVELVNSLGIHVPSLPQKSWLAILRQSKVLKNIGEHSALAPVKIQLLRGELKPEDILPPATDTTAPADAPQPVSKLQQELDKAIAEYKGEDIEPDETQPATPEQPVDIIDDDDQTKARLANLRPAQRLGVVAAASNATSDEQTLQSICHAQCEALWEQVFRADKHNPADALQLVSEFQQQPATDKWTEYTKNTFLADWRLVQECGQIPGLMMPDGWRLNLMQRREAALLLRDRARLNISGMGAGKTLSAIAGMQIIGANRVLVLCPNATIESSWQSALSNHLPLATTATRTWQPEFDGTKEPHWVLNHHELLSDMRATELAAFLWFFEPDAVIIDETHLCKCRDDATESQRYRNLTTLTDWCRDNNSAIYGLSGTPVVNELSEPISLLRLIRPDIAQKLDKRLSGDNAMAVHEALQPISSRYVPEPAARLIQKTIEVRADYLTEEALEASERNGIAVDAALAPAKLNALVDLASKQGKLLVFTSSVAGVVNEAVAALEQAGINAVVHTGSEKGEGYNGNVQRFITDPDVKVLIASTSTLATGFDGLQKVCRRIAFLTLPWTDAEQAQAIARILRQGIRAETVELTTLCAVLTDPLTGNEWSLDRQKLERLNSKRTLSAAVCDGVIPDESALRGGLRMVERAHKKWANNVRKKLEEQSK